MDVFDLIVIGGGPAGYLCAERAAQASLRVALVEERTLGGVCLNEGCIPTKSLLYCAKQYTAALHADLFGVETGEVRYDHAKALLRKEQTVKRLVRGVAAAMKAGGVSVFAGRAVLCGRDDAFCVRVGAQELRGKRLALAVGSQPVRPPIEGLADALASGFALTNREILDLPTLPEHLCCIGGGVIGLEMACYFASVGVKVTVVEMLPKLAGDTDPEICAVLMKTYQKLGMRFCLNAAVRSVAQGSVTYEDAEGLHTLACDKVLLAVGRRASTQSLGLETLGIETQRGAIVTDETLRTNIDGVWAIGDCNGKRMLAHTAYREAEVAVHAMLGIDDRMDYDRIPSVIYTEPEVACVGETEQSARDKGLSVKVAKASMLLSGRYVAQKAQSGDGFCKLVYDTQNDRLLGVSLVGDYASELILGAELMLGRPLEALRRQVFPHPTVGEVLREALFRL